ncbi:MAG TPA: GNAT family N-acetyltransferase [Kofleriaceae bacterium]|nr:GNAT family N-acetyltransferase [Kofleriaceae bacterium]
MGFDVRKLTPEDDRSGFRSGNPDLDRFFARYAGQNQFRHHIGTTYVAVDHAGAIAGFATVCASELAPDSLPASKRNRPPRYSLPVLRLARLAVDERHQGRGIGNLLLRAVFALALRMADDPGCVGVIVDAKPEAVGFYDKLGFVRLDVVAGELGDRPQPLPMFLELGQLARP